jgi:hypothetical protein
MDHETSSTSEGYCIKGLRIWFCAQCTHRPLCCRHLFSVIGLFAAGQFAGISDLEPDFGRTSGGTQRIVFLAADSDPLLSLRPQPNNPKTCSGGGEIVV